MARARARGPQRSERFFRPGYDTHLVAEWLPALDGVVERLQQGGTVADVGCGHGASTGLMAQAFPDAAFWGLDCHDASIATARRRTAEAGVERRVRFETTPGTGFPGRGYEVITTFDCLHDRGHPVGTARHGLGALHPNVSNVPDPLIAVARSGSQLTVASCLMTVRGGQEWRPPRWCATAPVTSGPTT